jgi:nucleoside-diphosphate-sugar epimerase
VRALITGGAGFIGSNLARRLVADGHLTSLCLRPSSSRWRIGDLGGRVHLAEVDLADSEAVRRLVRQTRPEWVFHLAAYGGNTGETRSTDAIRTNLLGTTHLLEEALDVGCRAFVNSGSSSEYGPKDHPPSEDEPLEPRTAYAVTKAASTWWCRSVGLAQQAPVVTLRLYSVFGPFEHPRRLMPRLLLAALDHHWPPLAAPWIAHDYVYVDDVVDAYLRAAMRAAERPGAVYNIGTGVQTSLGELARLVAELFEVPGEPAWGAYPARSWDTREWVAQPARATEQLGWRPGFDLRRGLLTMADWLATHRTQYSGDAARAVAGERS